MKLIDVDAQKPHNILEEHRQNLKRKRGTKYAQMRSKAMSRIASNWSSKGIARRNEEECDFLLSKYFCQASHLWKTKVRFLTSQAMIRSTCCHCPNCELIIT